MHDLILAKQILDQALKKAKRNKLKKISEIVVDFRKIKTIEKINSKNLKSNLRLLFKGTIAEKAKIIIKK